MLLRIRQKPKKDRKSRLPRHFSMSGEVSAANAWNGDRNSRTARCKGGLRPRREAVEARARTQ